MEGAVFETIGPQKNTYSFKKQKYFFFWKDPREMKRLV